MLGEAVAVFRESGPYRHNFPTALNALGNRCFRRGAHADSRGLVAVREHACSADRLHAVGLGGAHRVGRGGRARGPGRPLSRRAAAPPP